MSTSTTKPRLNAGDLDSRRGKLFDFSKGTLAMPLKGGPSVAGNKNTAGPKWFDMQTPEMTPEVERDLRMIRMRGYVDPKRYFKKDDFGGKNLPEHFQLGTVIAGLGERTLKRRERRENITKEFLADDKVKAYAKKVFDQVSVKRLSGGKKSYLRKQNSRAGRLGKKKMF